MDRNAKPHLSFGRILQMNLGFLGLQFSFGLQQANMSPIYSHLGADEAMIPLLWLAGPMTGLLVQPIIGALSDRTITHLGRRTPYFLIGAILCSLCLVAMPYSSTLWMAVSLLWLLDAANNITMEPYRAYVSDRLDERQRPLGFLTQSAFTGLAQTLSYLVPSLLVWWGFNRDVVDANGIPHLTRIAFMVGALLSLTTVLWSVLSVPELPLTDTERANIKREPLSARTALHDLVTALREMPVPMRQLIPAMLCQWFAMFAYWQFITFAIARALFVELPDKSALRDATLLNGQAGGLYNFVAFVAAFALVPFTRRFGARPIHALCLVASGAGMLALSQMTSTGWLFVPMVGIGLGWASMMGNPYLMLAGSIPSQRTGIYMGIFNIFIVIPMLIEGVTMPLLYHRVLGGDPRNVLIMSGLLMVCAAIATMHVRLTPPTGA